MNRDFCWAEIRIMDSFGPCGHVKRHHREGECGICKAVGYRGAQHDYAANAIPVIPGTEGGAVSER